jgi:hypothetical protein
MPSKSRPSNLKREREFNKRQRQQKKAAKAALKRERREEGPQSESETEAPPIEEVAGSAADFSPPSTAGL